MEMGVDKLITHGMVVTMDDQRRVIPDGAVAIAGKRIVAVGESAELEQQYANPSCKYMDARGRTVFPGFVNIHTHAALSILRGVCEDQGTTPAWTRSVPQGVFLSADDLYLFSLLGALEALKFGSTCIVDNYTHSPANVRAFDELGMRAIVSERIHDANLHKIPDGIYEFDEAIGEVMLARNVELIEKWHMKDDGRIRCCLGPHAPDTCSTTYLERIRSVANERGVGMVIHVAQGMREVELVRERTKGLSSVQYLREVGILGSDVIAGHCIYIDDQDIEILAETKTQVAHMPEGNAKWGATAPVPRMRRIGINVGLGTDNMAADMIEVMRFAVCISRIVGQNTTEPKAADVLQMATMNGARAVGLADEIGSIEVGKRADLVLVDYRKPHLMPVVDPVSNLIYTGLGSDVETVLVDGRVVVEHGQSTLVDEEAVLRAAQAVANARWQERAGLQPKYFLF